MVRNNFCAGRGYLVGMRYPIPTDPTEYQADEVPGIVGCCRLRCAVCRAEVRAEPGWDPDSKAGRRYECNCRDDIRGGVWVEDAAKYLEIERDEYPLPWACDGHPGVELPFELDGERIDRETDFPALVARTLGGWAPAAARPVERDTAAGWAMKLWARLRGTGLEDEVSRAAGGCLRSRDARVRAGALRFFERAGQVPGVEAIEDLAAASDGDPLDAVPDPTHSSSTVPLGRSVRIGLSNRIRQLRKAGLDPDRPLAIAKKLITHPGLADGLVTAVAECDWSWFEQHAEEIVRGTPEVCVDVLMKFPDPEEDGDGELAARLASIPGIDAEELRLWAESSLTGEALIAVQTVLDRPQR